MIGDLGESCFDIPSPSFFFRGIAFCCCFCESSMTIGVLVGVLDLPCIILVLFLVLKYSGFCLCLFAFDFTDVLRAIRAVVASFSVGSGDTLGDFSSSLLWVVELCSSFCPFSSFPFSFPSSYLSPPSSYFSSSISSLCSYVSSFVSSSVSPSFLIGPYNTSDYPITIVFIPLIYNFAISCCISSSSS